MTPFVSCICPTFGRAPKYLHLLQESVYWFTRQTYENAELLIFNDSPNQRIICNVPRVRVINHPTKIATLGEKYNQMVSLAKGTIIMPWEDDDVSLPGRISQAVEKLSSGSRYFNPKGSYYEEASTLGTLRDGGGVCHNCSAYHRSLWELVGGYEHVTGNQDARIDSLFQRYNGVSIPVDKSEWQYVYRWGVSDMHISAFAKPDDPLAMQRKYDEAVSTNAVVFIDPVMRYDYDMAVRGLTGCGCGGTCNRGCS